jgi:CRP/FNR family transcriptional regulator, cyclic AMP receptor protein
VAARFSRAVSLYEVEPDLFQHLDPAQAAAACSRAVAPVAMLRQGERDPWGCIDDPDGHLGLLVIDGLLTRNVSLLGRTTMGLIGSGDVLRPWDDSAEQISVPETVGWTVHLPTRVALLDQHFVERIAPWPGIAAALVSRSVQRTQWLEHHLAILENPRVDVRLLLFFWQLADRWGRVGPDGVTVPLPLTHKTLGRLVRAQRPSVTASLHELSELGVLTRRRIDAWILHGDPRRQLRLLMNGAEGP